MLTKPKQGSLHGQVASPCLAPQWLPPSRQSTPELPPFPLFNTPMLSLPSPFLPLLPTPLSCPQPFNLVSQSRRKRERSASARARTWPPDLVLKLPCMRACACVCVLCRSRSSLCSVWPADWGISPPWRRTCPSTLRPETRLCWSSSWNSSTVSGKSCVWRWEHTPEGSWEKRGVLKWHGWSKSLWTVQV